MPYVGKHIENFIRKVNDEAEEAAQKIFDKYQNELDEMIKKQMIKGDELLIAMGTATIRNKDSGYAYEFCNSVSRIQYTQQRAGFEPKDYNS